MKKIASAFREGGLGRAVAQIAGGTALGQLAIILGTLVTARLFDEAKFGLFGAYAAVVAIVGVAAAFRYDLAVPLPETEEETANVLSLALCLVVVVSALSGIACWLFGPWTLNRLGVGALTPYLWMFPLGILGTGAYTSLNYYAVRKKEAKALGQTKAAQGIATSGLQIGAGLAAANSPWGLISGHMVGRFAGIGRLLRLTKTGDGWLFRHASWDGMRQKAKQYRRFPIFSTPAALFNTAGLMAPVLLVVALFGEENGGSFTMAQRVIGLPGALVIGAVSQVFLGEAAERLRESPEKLMPLFDRITRKAVLMAGVPILCGLSAPWLAPLILGERWRLAGIMMAVLGVSYGAALVVSPVSSIASITERQDLQLIGDVVRLALIMGAFFVPHLLGWPVLWAVILYACLMVVAYGGFYLLYRGLAKQQVHQAMEARQK